MEISYGFKKDFSNIEKMLIFFKTLFLLLPCIFLNVQTKKESFALSRKLERLTKCCKI